MIFIVSVEVRQVGFFNMDGWGSNPLSYWWTLVKLAIFTHAPNIFIIVKIPCGVSERCCGAMLYEWGAICGLTPFY